jgi:hypothetical protein
MSSVTALALSVLGLLNLIILLALVRRVDALAARLDRPGGRPAREDPPPLPAVGSKVTPFAAVTTDGQQVSVADLSGRTLVGFFAEGCTMCHDMAPRFARHASVFPGGRDRVLAVVVAGAISSSPLVTELSPVARIVLESGDGPTVRAFRVDGFPAACVLQDNVVVAAEGKLERLRLPEPQPSHP